MMFKKLFELYVCKLIMEYRSDAFYTLLLYAFN